MKSPDEFMVAMEWDSLPENTSENLGSHDCECNTLTLEELEEGVDISFYPNPLTGDVGF